MIEWSHALHQVTGAMARHGSREPEPEALVEWASSLLRVARSMREAAEAASEERKKKRRH